MKKFFLCAAITLMTASFLCAQSKLSNRTKVIANSARNSISANSPSRMTVKMSDDIEYIAAFIRFNGSIDRSVIEAYGGVVRSEYPVISTVTANIPISAIESLAADNRIAYIEASQKSNLNMDRARSASRAQQAMDGESPLPHGYKGSGVIVGVVDQEIQVSHINFWDETRSRFRIKSFWNQNDNGKGGHGFSYGKFYNDSASIIAKKFDVSQMSSGHATHVTGIAAGADHSLDYYGIAGEADIVITSTTGEDADLTDGVQYIFQYADSVQKPCVINISMGSELGPHDGTDLCSQILEALSGQGRVIVGAAGNSGSANMHIIKDFTPSDSIAKTFIDFTYGSWMPYSLLDAWGEVGKDFELAVVAVSTSNDSVMITTPFIRASLDTSFSCTASKLSSSTNRFTVEVASGINAINHKPNISIECDFSDLSSDLEPGVIIRTDSGRVHLWTNDYYSTFTDNGYSRKGWMSGDDDMTIGEGIAICKKVVAVGSYVNKSESYYGSTVGDISSFSSKGPTIDGRIKPEITAPGEGIYASYPSKRKYAADYSTTIGDETYYYGSMSGTSMACPYVTGVVATWLEADPTLNYDALIDVFANSAMKDKYTGYNLPDNTWGYGKIDAINGLLYILGLPQNVENISDHQIAALYPNPTVGDFTIGFASTDRNVVISIYDMSGREIYINTLGDITAGEVRSFSIADAPDGIYTIRIAGEKLSKCYKLVKQ